MRTIGCRAAIATAAVLAAVCLFAPCRQERFLQAGAAYQYYASGSGTLSSKLLVKYDFNGDLNDSAGNHHAQLYSYTQNGVISVSADRFLTDSDRDKVFNVRGLSLGDKPDGKPLADRCGDYAVKLPAGMIPSGTSELTVSLWYKSEQIYGMAKKADGRPWETACDWLAFGDNLNKLIFSSKPSDTGEYAGGAFLNGKRIAAADRPFCSDIWSHFAMVIKGREITFYIDGEKINDEKAAVEKANRDLIAIINCGGYIGGGAFARYDDKNGGWVDDFRLYGKAATDSEIAAIYADGLNGLTFSVSGGTTLRKSAANPMHYEADAPANARDCRLTIMPIAPSAHIQLSQGGYDAKTGIAVLPLTANLNDYTVECISQNGRKAVYTLTVNRPSAIAGTKSTALPPSDGISTPAGSTANNGGTGRPSASAGGALPITGGTSDTAARPPDSGSLVSHPEDKPASYEAQASRQIFDLGKSASHDMVFIVFGIVLVLGVSVTFFIGNKGKNREH